MTETEKALLEALLALEVAVARMRTSAGKPDLLPLFAEIDRCAAQLPAAGTDPSLRHYVQKRSYQKARLHLQGRDAENSAGNCGHV